MPSRPRFRPAPGRCERGAGRASTVLARALLAVALCMGAVPRAEAMCGGDPVRTVIPHKLNYALLGVHDAVAPPDEDEARQGYERDAWESKFQISLKFLFFDSIPLYLGYTQKSFWQVYNSEHSSPFRETNYNPEGFLDCQGPLEALPEMGIRVGIEHESNGQTVERSRSWNRVYVWPRYVSSAGGWRAALKYWERFPEQDKSDPREAEGDDNRRIDSYLGRFELYVEFLRWDPHELYLMVRKGTRDDSGTYDAIYLLRIGQGTGSGSLYGMLQFFSGYGESLIDYDHRVEKLGFGFAFR